MGDVLIALAPTLVAAVAIFGARALLVVFACVISCVISELLFELACKKPITITDLSACVTGTILAYNLPVTIPIWQAVFGSIVAIVVIKQLFGGIGQNFANPAATARIVMLLAFSGTMTTWVSLDAVSSATPLALLADSFNGITPSAPLPSLSAMILGLHGGGLGETSAVALLIGGIYLIYRRVISWHVPVAVLATVALMTGIFGASPLYHLLSGGVMLGAFFMATDYSTTPSTNVGRVIYGIGCGAITVLIRLWGNSPEGMSFAILLMNILTPHISNLTRNKPFGGVAA